MKYKGITLGIVSLVSGVTLVGYVDGNEDSSQKDETAQNESMGVEHYDMEHSGSEEVHKGLKVAENPKYEVGSKVIIKEGHSACHGNKASTALSINHIPFMLDMLRC